MPKAWRFQPQRPDVRDVLARALGVSPVLAQLLANRGITDPGEARAFLRPSLDTLADPFLLPDMERAVERVQRAIKDKEPIVVHGDYDVDGLTGTALLINSSASSASRLASTSRIASPTATRSPSRPSRSSANGGRRF